MKKRNTILFMFVVLVSISFIIGCTDQSKEVNKGNRDNSGLSTIRYGGQHYPGEYVLAGDPGIWTENGISVEHTLFSSGAENNEALISGNVDINAGSDTKSNALFNAMPGEVVLIGTLQRGNRYSTIVRSDSDIESWDDLRGKTIATRFGTGAESVIRKYYDQNGYSWDDFKYVNLKIEDMSAALEQGQIDAFTAWEPTPAIAEAKGIGRVMRTYGDVSLVPVCLHTTKKYAAGHENEIVHFLAAHLDKAELIKNNPKEAAQIASDAASAGGIEIDPLAFEKIFERIDFNLDIDEDVISSIKETGEFLVEQGKIKSVPEIEFDESYLIKAKELREKGSY